MKFSALNTSDKDFPVMPRDPVEAGDDGDERGLIEKRMMPNLATVQPTDAKMEAEKTSKAPPAPVFIALFLTAIWAFFCGAYALIFPTTLAGISTSPANMAMMAITVFLPIVLIWCAVLVADTVRSMRQEAGELRAEMMQLRAISGQSLAAYQSKDPTEDAWVKEQLLQLGALAQKTEGQVADIAFRTAAKRRKSDKNRGVPALTQIANQARDIDQPALPLAGGRNENNTPITVEELLKAMNFPDSADDKEGFRVMRRAKEDRALFETLASCQSLLGLMAQDGIYMDDLKTDPSDPDLWRRYAKGERSNETTALGVIRDRSAIALMRNRLRVDGNFRIQAHRYLVQFIDLLGRFEPTAEDKEILDLIETRSGKAFALLARVSKGFDPV